MERLRNDYSDPVIVNTPDIKPTYLIELDIFDKSFYFLADMINDSNYDI